MQNLFKNQFVQALGVAALVYLIFQALGWGVESILNILESFSRWYRYLRKGFIYLELTITINPS
ncbi:hypothetical protein [Crocosphaera watsonii]|uniref:Uncharacterized protein n=4 Tax=Crocosphaera watsonii TaxID=263511 RepID=T2JUZ0_CROWT|nr:hypothetical protein [Crocosphaera watsonii]EHJ11433.1 hypothetical protein CWATWH0003_3827 [Crocosphaera watsonii WH 0003]MCH2245849.1 hypothetical protein [Crocosphaera sp.]CCQ52786.1 hypothetical protein CWATWH8502_1858 [Crocosphaera watsonii WH 8502]NQZ63021.1 hypothetical protein [Crocosphaera sp.]CCQ57792.1 hypothetical protein CWATWH0005_2671 [Crocosphaera watsonii WH 0005]